MNIVDLILYQCRIQPPVAALCAPGSALNLISYSRLERFIHNIGWQASALGLARGSVVALLVNDQIFHAALILGLGHLGVTTLSLRSAELPPNIRVDAVISDTPQSFRTGARIILADVNWTTGDGTPPASARAAQIDDSDICRIVLTSGTTGDAKAVALSHRMVLDRTFLYTWVFGSAVAHSSRIFVDPGLATAFGYFFLIYILAKGGTVFFRGADAIETMQAFDLYKVQGIVAAPAALAEFADHYEDAAIFASKFDVIVTGASPLSKALSDRIRSRLCSNLLYGYGSAEASTAAMTPRSLTEHVPGAVGYIAPGFSVEAVDEADKVLPAGREGRIRIRGALVVDRYLADPAETEKVFRDGWFYPGDIGAVTADRMLVIAGREKSVLNVGGDKIGPERIEEVLLAFAGVDQAAAFGMANPLGIEEIWAAVVWRSHPDEAALLAHCQRRLPAGFIPARFLAVKALPRNAMGKIDRQRLSVIGAGPQQ